MGRLLAGLLLVLVAACGATGPPDEPPVTAAAPGSPAAAAACPSTVNLDAPATEALPPDFSAAWVFRCEDEQRAVPGDGSWWFRVQERADTDAADLLAALRRPDEESTPGTVCPGVAYAAGWFALVDAGGRVVRPRVPRNACGQPQRRALDAIRALPFHEAGATRLRQEETQKAIDTGCGMLGTKAPDYDVLESDRPGAARPLWKRPPEALKICLYRSRGGQQEVVSARTISGRAMAGLIDRVEALPAAARCAGTLPTSWATVEYVREGWYDDGLLVELDGCHRLSRPDHSLARVDAATARLVTTLAH